MDVVAGLAFQTFAGMNARLMLLDGIPVTGRAFRSLELLRMRQVLRITVTGNAFDLPMVCFLVFLMTVEAVLCHATKRKEEKGEDRREEETFHSLVHSAV
jgi:hypothetical protein